MKRLFVPFAIACIGSSLPAQTDTGRIAIDWNSTMTVSKPKTTVKGKGG